MVAFLFIQSTAFSCPDIRYLHGTSNPYPPPRLILFPVTLVSKNDHNDQEHLKGIERDDEDVTTDDSLAIKSISEALQLVDRIKCFPRQYEDDKINESLEVVTEKLEDIMIRNRQQKKINDYFNL